MSLSAPHLGHRQYPQSMHHQDLYCSACKAMVLEALKELHSKKSEADVFDTMSGICDSKHYSIYEFPPPDMRDGCTAVMSDWEETFEYALVNRQQGEDLVQNICTDITKACQNVNLSKMSNVPDTITVDGKPVPIVIN